MKHRTPSAIRAAKPIAALQGIGSLESPIYYHRRVVDQADLDELNHVNNLVYLKWCLKAAVAHSADVGWPASRYHQFGYGFIVREHRIKYRLPAHLGEAIEIQTWIDSLKPASSLRKYRILRATDGQCLVVAETNWAFVDLKTLALSRIPETIQQAFRNPPASS